VNYDDAYFDTTRARVLICDAPTYESRTRCEMQVPAEWSPTAIVLRGNPGAFDDGETVYMYVVTDRGEVNQVGCSITVG
jgi:hypothetical protein